MSWGVLMVDFSNLRLTRFGDSTVTAAVVESEVREPGSEMSRAFTTVAERPSTAWRMSWTVTKGRRSRASSARSSLLLVYTRRHVPLSFSIACRRAPHCSKLHCAARKRTMWRTGSVIIAAGQRRGAGRGGRAAPRWGWQWAT